MDKFADPALGLWRLWRHGHRPDVREYLARDGLGALSPSQVAATLRVDQRERWEIGERVTVDAYLRDFEALRADPEAGLELVYAEYLLREERGEAPTLEDYRLAYPELADRLELQIQLRRALDAAPEDDTWRSGLGPGDTSAPSHWPSVAGYEVLAELGRGGMGVVYQARQRKLNRVVALKMILVGAQASPGQRDRFQREAEAVACLQHPNIVQIFEVGEQEGLPFLALEFVDGGNLAQLPSQAPMRPRPAARLVETLARAVHAAHRAGIVHRDLKPANVLLTADGIPKIADFGLARRVDAGASLSEIGHLQGTPLYMAPEQVDGRCGEVGPLADIHALGVVLYELLTGHPPFQAASALEVMEQVRTAEPVAPRRLQPRLPRDLETIALKCLRKDPRRRYASAEALADDLHRFGEGQPIAARPVGRIERLGRWCLREPKVAGLFLGRQSSLDEVLFQLLEVGRRIAAEPAAQRPHRLPPLQRRA